MNHVELNRSKDGGVDINGIEHLVAGFCGSMSTAAEAATIIYGYTTTTGSFGAGFVAKNSWQDAVDEANSFAPIGTPMAMSSNTWQGAAEADTTRVPTR